MSTDSILWRWYYYWWATETFDQSVPHWTEEHLSMDGVKRSCHPKEGWPRDSTAGFATEMRIALALGLTAMVPPLGIPSSIEKLRSLLVAHWVRVAKHALESMVYDGLEDFGVSVSRFSNPMRIYKFGQPLETTSDLDGALAGAVGFEPDQCAHVHVVERDYRHRAIGLCLRCCTMRSTNEVTIRPEPCRMLYGDQPSTKKEPTPVEPRRPSLSQPYAHNPGARDGFPLGHAPGDAAIFSTYLGTLRGGR